MQQRIKSEDICSSSYIAWWWWWWWWYINMDRCRLLATLPPLSLPFYQSPVNTVLPSTFAINTSTWMRQFCVYAFATQKQRATWKETCRSSVEWGPMFTTNTVCVHNLPSNLRVLDAIDHTHILSLSDSANRIILYTYWGHVSKLISFCGQVCRQTNCGLWNMCPNCPLHGPPLRWIRPMNLSD